MNPAPNKPVSLLPFPVAQVILALGIHAAAPSRRHWDTTALSQVLHVLPRSRSPLATKVALLRLPHIDLNTATKVGDVDLLRFMLLWSHEPLGRPIKYSTDVGPLFRAGFVDVLDWWVDESGLPLHWDSQSIFPACESGNLAVLEWWRQRGFPHADHDQLSIAINSAGRAGNVGLLEWFLTHLPHPLRSGSFQYCYWGAAVNGHPAVLDFWLGTMGTLGIPITAEHVHDILRLSFKEKQIPCLEWCKSHMELMELFNRQATGICANVPCDEPSLQALAKHGDLLEWITALGIQQPESDTSNQVEPYTLHWLNDKQEPCAVHDPEFSEDAASASNEMLAWICAHGGICPGVPGTGAHSAYICARDYGRVDVLDWLFDNRYTFDDGLLDFWAGVKMSDTEHVLVLDWISAHVSVTPSELKHMAFKSWGGALKVASSYGHTAALAWWRQHLAETGALELALSEHATHKVDNLFEPIFANKNVAVLDWWLNHSGTLRDCFAIGKPYVQACIGSNSTRQPCDPKVFAVLQLWLDAGLPMDHAACINAASVSGNLDLLDWFLHVVCVPKSTFIEAFTRIEFNSRQEWDCQDHPTHGESLWWWKVNVPEVAGLTINRSRYDNPIHAHLLKNVFKVQHTLQSPLDASSLGNVSMLRYLKREHDKQFSQLRTDDITAALVSASGCDRVAVLEWWRSYSGFTLSECPAAIVDGAEAIGELARQWWLNSGLCDYIKPETDSEDEGDEDVESDASVDPDDPVD